MAGLVDLGMALGAPLAKIVGDVLNRVLPAEKMSEKDRATIESQVLLELQKQDFSALEGQLKINLAEAQSESRWVSGWRPHVGWVCGFALSYAFILQPFMVFAIQTGYWLTKAMPGTPFPQPPVLDIQSLMTILLGMLGLGGMRTYEKIKGVAGGKS